MMTKGDNLTISNKNIDKFTVQQVENFKNMKGGRKLIIYVNAAAETVTFLRIFVTHLLHENSRYNDTIKSRKNM